ncbi:hypothetical protein SLE2022_362940 [Rubroshorea leprosula]
MGGREVGSENKNLFEKKNERQQGIAELAQNDKIGRQIGGRIVTAFLYVQPVNLLPPLTAISHSPSPRPPTVAGHPSLSRVYNPAETTAGPSLTLCPCMEPVNP